MFRILKLVLLAAVANCAPATFLPFAAPLAQPYFFIGPQPQVQFQYQPLVKIQQPFAPAPATKTDSPKSQYVLMYAAAAAPQLPLVAVRQEGGGTPDILSQFNNWWTDFSMNFGQTPAPPPAEESSTAAAQTDSKMAPMEKNWDSPMMSMEKNRESPMMSMEKNRESPMMSMEKNRDTMQPLMPASTMPLNMNKQRFYLINSLPQFYGNFAALPTATITNPIIAIEQPRARSAVDSIPAESENVEQQIRTQEVIELAQQPAVTQPIPQLQLRSNIVEPLQRLEIDQPVVPLVNNEPVPEVAAQEIARFLSESRSQDTEVNTANKLNANNEPNKLRTDEEPLEEETSIAQAKPSAIALSGKGGLSSSSPIATAIVGEGGLAQASPTAISLAGDFEEEEKKLKQTEPFAPL